MKKSITFIRRQQNALSAERRKSLSRPPPPSSPLSWRLPPPSTWGGDRQQLYMSAMARESSGRSVLSPFVSSCQKRTAAARFCSLELKKKSHPSKPKFTRPTDRLVGVGVGVFDVGLGRMPYPTQLAYDTAEIHEKVRRPFCEPVPVPV